jgi:hypothetical protein
VTFANKILWWLSRCTDMIGQSLQGFCPLGRSASVDHKPSVLPAKRIRDTRWQASNSIPQSSERLRKAMLVHSQADGRAGHPWSMLLPKPPLAVRSPAALGRLENDRLQASGRDLCELVLPVSPRGRWPGVTETPGMSDERRLLAGRATPRLRTTDLRERTTPPMIGPRGLKGPSMLFVQKSGKHKKDI